MSTEHSPDTHLIVDIGCGQFPFPLRSGGRQLGPGQEYRGYDLFEQQYMDPDSVNRTLADALGRTGARGRVERADARSLPLDDGVADEIVMINFLSAPRVDRPAVAREIGRVLKRPSGIVTVVDTYAPAAYPVHNVRSILRPIGLRQKNLGQERNSHAIGQYSDGRHYRERYIAVFGFPLNDVTNTQDSHLKIGGQCSLLDILSKDNHNMAESTRDIIREGIQAIAEQTSEAKNANGTVTDVSQEQEARVKRVREHFGAFATHIGAAAQAHTDIFEAFQPLIDPSQEIVRMNGKVGEHAASAQGTLDAVVGESAHEAITEGVRPSLENWLTVNEVQGKNSLTLADVYQIVGKQASEREQAMDELVGALGSYIEQVIEPIVEMQGKTTEAFELQGTTIDNTAQAADMYLTVQR